MSPKLPETRESLGKYQDFPRLKSNFPCPKSNFVNGFLLSSTAFCFPQQLSNFPQRLSTFREIRENLSMVASIRNIANQALYFLPLAPRAS
jgi:hypothetical protein